MMYRLGAVSRMTYRRGLTTNPIQRGNRGSAQAPPLNGLSGDAEAPSLTEQMSDFIKGVKEKATGLIELTEQITTGRFVGTNLAKRLWEQAEGLSAELDVLWGHTREAWSGSVAGSEIVAGSSISSGPEFGLGQILDIEQKITDANAHSELAIFSLARIREAAMKALRCQVNVEPQRALFLLQDDVM